MLEHDLLELFVRPLASEGIRYLIGGSVASMLYGEPRVTHDVDLIVILGPERVSRLPMLYPSPDYYVPPLEVIVAEIARERRGHFNVIHVESGLKADFFPANRDELHTWAFLNERRYSIRGLSITLAPPEYVIVRKLEYYREGGSEKHLRDIRSMLAVSGDQVDRVALEDWIRRRGVTAEWEKATG